MDISNFYLNTPLKRPEFIRLNIRDIPREIIEEYKLRDIADKDGSIYLQANKGMYGLPHGGLIANVLLEKRLNKAGYFQSKLVPGLWSHKTRPVTFTLVVDDFGVKYIGKEHALHLKAVIEQHYKCSAEWAGDRYIGITLDWDYTKRQVHLSMPGYKSKALKQFQHHKSSTPQHSPFQSTPINYGAKKQYAIQPSEATPLNKTDKKFIQQVCGKFLYLGRAVDPTLLCPISAIASQSSNPTTDTMEQTKQLLDYIATQEDAVITYKASDMILAVHSDASYLSEPKARSRAGGHFFLSAAVDAPPNNGAILNIAHIIKHVMASATEAELAPLYTLHEKQSTYVSSSTNSVTNNQPLRYRPKIQRQKQCVTVKSNPSKPRQWICASTGFAIANAKNNFTFIGIPANSTMPIIGLNTIQPSITKKYAGISSLLIRLLRCCVSNRKISLQAQQLEHNH